MKRFAIRNLGWYCYRKDIVDWICLTLNTACFMKKKLGQVVELQKNHIVLFKSPREVMQFSTFTVKLGLGTKRVDCYWDVTSVPDGYLLIDLSPRKNDRLRSFTKLWIDSLILLFAQTVEGLTVFGRWKHKFSLLSRCFIRFPVNANVFSFRLPQTSLSDFFVNA